MKPLAKLLAVLTLNLLVSILWSQAADIEINADCRLRHAITAANADKPAGGCPAGKGADTIRLREDVSLDAALPTIGSEIAFEGAGHTIDGAGLARIFHVQERGRLTINNLTLANGRSDQGGAVFNYGGTLIVENGVFVDNSATVAGGAIYSVTGTTEIRNSRFRGNQSEHSGGAIANREAALSVSDSSFENNGATNVGGAILSFDSATLIIQASQFAANATDHADGAGGAIASIQSTLDIAESAFSGNRAGYGSALYTSKGEASASNSRFSDHSTDGYGGAIYAREGALSLTGSLFHNNASTVSGGAIFSRGGLLSIDRGEFLGNSSDSGGAIYGDESSILDLRDSQFNGNSATLGGALTAGHSTLTIASSQFEANQAQVAGGAIYSQYSNFDIKHSAFSRNLSDSGAAIRQDSGEATITDSVVSHNGSVDGGSAIHTGGGKLRIEKSQLNYNKAFVAAAVASRNATVSFLNSQVSHNQADAFAGAISGEGGKIIVSKSNVSHNSASIAGGIRTSNAALAMTNSTLSGNLARDFVGGALLISGGGSSTLVYVTIGHNSADEGGGIYIESGAEVNLHNSIIFGSDSGGDCVGAFKSQSGNLIQDGSCSASLSGDPMLGELAAPDDGAPAYYPLLTSSPGIDAVNCVDIVLSDQIGTPRPQGARLRYRRD